MKKYDNIRRDIQRNCREHIKLIKYISNFHGPIIEVATKISEAYRNRRRVLIYGNGGSCADALHFGGELEGAYKNRNRIPLPVITLSNPATMTAVANDFGYDEIFARNVRAIANERDIVIGFSTSGKSPNIIEAFREAKKKKAITVAFTGQDGMKEKGLVDILVNIPSKNTPRIQEAHEFIYHEICGLVEERLFG